MDEQYDTAGESSSGTDRAKDKAREVKDRVEDKVEELASDARDRGKEAVREGKEKARELGDEASRIAHTRAEEQKDRLTSGMRTVADALRHGTEQLPEERQRYGSIIENVADRVEGVSRYLDERDVDGLTREARQFARKHTPLFLGGAFALGLAGARFLKSSGSEATDGSSWESGRRGAGRLESGAPGRTFRTGGSEQEPPATPTRPGSRTEAWTSYDRDPAPAPKYRRSSTVHEASDGNQEEGGYE